jgi:hypothetical protein
LKARQDIISNGKDKRLYAKKGDELFLVADHDNTLIVKLKKGDPFPANIEKLII